MNVERFREIRERRGLSRHELARLCGFQPMQIYRYEAGENDPSTENLSKLAQVLEVSADYLLGITDDPQGHFGDSSFNDIEKDLISAYRREGWIGVFRLGVEHIRDK
jgi:transcriptional regulator with XRE-family HTH domain